MTDPTLHIGLLLCDDVPGEYQSQYGSYTGMFERRIRQTDPRIRLTPFRCMEMELPHSPAQFDGYLISGSRAGAYEAAPWIAELTDFVRACQRQPVKVVGICFGHQLLAHALGGKAEKAAVGWGFGIQCSRILKQPPWMPDAATADYNLVVIHQDQVVALPPGFETIADNDFCANSMIVSGDFALGIQGHPEFTPEFCAFRAEFRRELIGEAVYQNALQSIQDLTPDSERVFGWVSAFLRYRA